MEGLKRNYKKHKLRNLGRKYKVMYQWQPEIPQEFFDRSYLLFIYSVRMKGIACVILIYYSRAA